MLSIFGGELIIGGRKQQEKPQKCELTYCHSDGARMSLRKTLSLSLTRMSVWLWTTGDEGCFLPPLPASFENKWGKFQTEPNRPPELPSGGQCQLGPDMFGSCPITPDGHLKVQMGLTELKEHRPDKKAPTKVLDYEN